MLHCQLDHDCLQKGATKILRTMGSAKTDMHNVINVGQAPYKNCYDYYSVTDICQKTQEPHCKYAVGSIKTALQKPGILPDREENKPSIEYSNACFLPQNYAIYGNPTRISESP